MKLVDAHAHVFLEDMPHIPDPRHRITYDFAIDQYLKIMDEHGVERACLAAASPYGDYNDYLIAAVKANKGRLRGTVIVEPTVERYVLEAMKADGIVGVRLPFISLKMLPDLTTYEWRRTLRRFRDLDWHVHLHLDGPRLPQVLPALEACGVKLVVDHLGRPDPQLGIQCKGFQQMLRLMENGRTWVKASGLYRLGKTECATYGREILRVHGPDRLLWASDCPFVGNEKTAKYQETIDAVREWVPSSSLEKVFAENALALYF